MDKLTKELKKLAKDNPQLNSTELALLYGHGYATEKYYAAMKVTNKYKLGWKE